MKNQEETKFKYYFQKSDKNYFTRVVTLTEIEDGKAFQGIVGSYSHREQYTGKKDKNKKEIYNADILKTKDFDYTHKPDLIFEVKYGTFSIRDCEGYYLEETFYQGFNIKNPDNEQEFEIIGNKYENKELLDE